MRLTQSTELKPSPFIAASVKSVLQRKCACGGTPRSSGECEACLKKRLQRKIGNWQSAIENDSSVPPIVHEVLRSPGQPLDLATRAFMEPRFGHDFSRVRIHTDALAAESARAVNAPAYTVGSHVVFGQEYVPTMSMARQLLAHELTHTIQQSTVPQSTFTLNGTLRATPVADESEKEADLAAADIMAGRHKTMSVNERLAPLLQRQFRTPPVSVRSPVAEEAVTQLTEFMPGRTLTSNERASARGVFGNSIDYSRVRLIPTGVLEYRTVANSIRVPENFSISDEEMAQTFIHEMTHVWQYQHGGTSYMSISLGTQIAAHEGRGNRNFAYDYQIAAGRSFFNFTPEQQAFMVENYFAMLRDQTAIPRDQVAGTTRTYQSNHLDATTGFRAPLTATDRSSEISSELPLHEPLMRQMRAALRMPEADLLMLRAKEVMQIPGQEIAPVPPERQIAPVKPLIEIRFPGL